MLRSAKIFLRGRLVAAADQLHRADSLEELQASLMVQHRLWRLLKRHIRASCCKNPEMSRLADYVLATLGNGGLPDDRAIATLAGINLRAGALIMQACPRQAATCRGDPGRRRRADPAVGERADCHA